MKHNSRYYRSVYMKLVSRTARRCGYTDAEIAQKVSSFTPGRTLKGSEIAKFSRVKSSPAISGWIIRGAAQFWHSLDCEAEVELSSTEVEAIEQINKYLDASPA